VSDHAIRRRLPRGILLDYGGTLVEEVDYDPVAGNIALLALATPPPGLTLERVMERVTRVTAEVAARRDTFGIETPWPALTRLIYDHFGMRFDRSMDELELAFWDASVTTRGMPGAKAALDVFHAANIPLAVLSNSSFGARTIRHEIAKHGLADHLAFVMVTADYVVRKPNPLLFDVAATRFGVPAGDIWFVGDRLDTDVVGAKAAGMTAVWLRPADAPLSDEPDLTVRDWAELVRCLEATRA
jgi:putative hydrolase of the HAD superfamily